MYKPVFYGHLWKKSLKKIDEQHRPRIIKAIKNLCKRENPCLDINVIKLKTNNISGRYRLRVDNYRLFFNIDNEKSHIYFTEILRRNDVTYRPK